jgi:peptide/nickel transport system permease protein
VTGDRAVSKKMVVGWTIVGVIALAGALAPWIASHGPLQQDLTSRLRGPSPKHWFGTDELGRDVFSRSLDAIRIDLSLALVGALLPAVVGTLLGSIAGYRGGWVDTLIMRVADAVQAFPFHILLIAIVFSLGAGPKAFVVAITALGWVTYARLIRGEVLRVRGMDYIAAARLSGLSHRRTLLKHLLPNALPQSIVYFASDAVLVLLTLAAVSFFGLGVQLPDAEWGQMIAVGATYLQRAWWMSLFPGLMIVATGVGLTLTADGLDDRRRRR